jgi:predicted RNA binding protein YcfA (HicA-like mRNA interferase family)
MKSNELFRLLTDAGWEVYREGKGSHKIMRHPAHPDKQLTVPAHGSKEVGKGLVNAILKQAGLR